MSELTEMQDEPLGEEEADDEFVSEDALPESEGRGARFTVCIEGGRLPTRVDKLLAERLEGTTRAQIQRWISEGRVQIEGTVLRSKDKVSGGARIEVRPGPPQLTQALPDPSVQIEVLYEDPHLLVVSKPAGLVVHPGRGHASGTLVNGLLARPGFEWAPSDPRDPEGQLRPGIVHRIDKDTSGILVVAKSARAREGLKEQFAAHTIERVYQAITVGIPSEGKIETLHGRDPVSRLKFSSRVTQGKKAITYVRVQERLAQDQAALIECRLETGRTHQIRVHLSQERNAPLLADELYGGYRGAPAVLLCARKLARQALHAAVLGFQHPITAEQLRFEQELPADFQEALSSLRGA